MVEVSRDGNAVYLSNSLYGAWDEQFYPEGLRGWVTRVMPIPTAACDRPEIFRAIQRRTAHQVRLEGGDSSSDSYCYP